jgi:A/G-specific adenine glycosylase
MNARDLPWRRTRDPYRIWVSEIMLQQTRVAAAIPYFERFLERFPKVENLANACEADVMTVWSGLGYYTRARNLHRAAKRIMERDGFPDDYASIRELPGVGDYTAAAVASIAFGLPYAVVDGNVTRVLSRLSCSGTGVKELAAMLLDRTDPGQHNQALMELGAAICLPSEPKCSECPVAGLCLAKKLGHQQEFPAKKRRPAPVSVSKTLLLIEKKGRFLLQPRNGFWELPEAEELPGAVVESEFGRFRHSIMHRKYTVTAATASVRGTPQGFQWMLADPAGIPLSTMTRKALRCGAVPLDRSRPPGRQVSS